MDSRAKNWFESPLGLALWRLEQDLAEAMLGQAFGLYGIQVGDWGSSQALLDHLKTSSKFGFSSHGDIEFAGDGCELPLGKDSVDVIVLPHTLESCEDPRILLREAHQALVGSGHLLIMGFNPFGPWGWRSRISRSDFPLPHSRLLSRHRLLDWLALLGMRVVKRANYGFTWPMQNETIVRLCLRHEEKARRFVPMLSAGYMLLAQKKSLSGTVIPMKKKKMRIQSAATEPSARAFGRKAETVVSIPRTKRFD